MSTNPTSVINDDGRKYWTRSGSLRRASHAFVSYRGVELEVEYFAHGFDADAFVEQVKSVQIGGVECLALFSEEQQADLCERIQQSWGAE